MVLSLHVVTYDNPEFTIFERGNGLTILIRPTHNQSQDDATRYARQYRVMNYVRTTLEIGVDCAIFYVRQTEIMGLYNRAKLDVDVCVHVSVGLLRVLSFRSVRHAVEHLSDTLEKENCGIPEGIKSKDIQVNVHLDGCRTDESRKEDCGKDDDAWPLHLSNSAMREGFRHCAGVVKQALEKILTEACEELAASK